MCANFGAGGSLVRGQALGPRAEVVQQIPTIIFSPPVPPVGFFYGGAGCSEALIAPHLNTSPRTIVLSSNRRGRMDMAHDKQGDKAIICLWYDKDAEEAANFYARLFPDSKVTAVHRAPGDYPSGKEGDVLTVEFTVLGIPCLGLNGGTAFKQTEAFSFQVLTESQEETDRYWNAIVGNGGAESACGWCKDKWGLSWQITPKVLAKAIGNPDRAAAKRAFAAMMSMRKINIAEIEKALKG